MEYLLLGLRTKLSIVQNNLYLLPLKPDVILLKETWLNSYIENSELGLQYYIIYRCDRNYKRLNEVGGGVLVAVKSLLTSKIISFNDTGHEEIFILVKTSTRNYIFGCTYITDSPSTVYLQHLRRIEEI